MIECCIYHKPRKFDESSSDESDREDVKKKGKSCKDDNCKNKENCDSQKK